jgi:hypothetical protein
MGPVAYGQPEVRGLEGAVGGVGEEQEVVWLHVTVDDALGMALADEAQDGPDKACRGGRGKGLE